MEVQDDELVSQTYATRNGEDQSMRINESPSKFFHFSHHNETEELDQRIADMGKEYEEMLNRRKELRKRPIIPIVSTVLEPPAQPKTDDIVSVLAKLNENVSKMMSKMEFRRIHFRS